MAELPVTYLLTFSESEVPNEINSEWHELIRCKDCKHWLPHAQFGFDEDNNEYHNYCGRLVPDDDYYAFTREADEFCSRAERKGE